MRKFLLKFCIFIFVILSVGLISIKSQVLPKPIYDNSLILAMTYSLETGTQEEIDNIKALYDNGLYAPLYFTHFVNIDMDWSTDPNNADAGIQSFKDKMNLLIGKARSNNVGLHVIISYGLARNVDNYKSAKEEDIRNAMWYNDNNLATEPQMSGSINKYVFGTVSRYARKLREFHNAKIEAMCNYMKQIQDSNPDMNIVFSGPGEVELNNGRIGNPPGQPHLQYHFTDYSPFAVLEFRDWIRHKGLYEIGEMYDGQGYTNGGARYQGGNGLTNLNTDFGTSFTSWQLKYFDWYLTDSVSSDPNSIPFANYIQNGMLPTSGDHYVSGGFDPPREMVALGTDNFYDLWSTFREAMVANYVKDMASIARNSNFPRNQYYTHQIPADYLFGKQPSSPYKDPRYYSSASPMWTADAFDDIGMAITLYDVKIGTTLYETTQYAVSGISNTSNNWAALEYNPEVSVDGAVLSPVADLYNKFMDLYNNNVHVLSLFKWIGEGYTFKNTNRGTAFGNFFNGIKDKARQSLSTVFTPIAVSGLNGVYNAGTIELKWDGKIWSDRLSEWGHWGDFKDFIIYRGYSEDFICDAGSAIARTRSYFYNDTSYDPLAIVYYKIVAVNINGQKGPPSASVSIIPSSDPIAIIDVSRDKLYFNATTRGVVTSSQEFLVINEGTADLNWNLAVDKTWINVDKTSGTNTQKVVVSVDPSGLSNGDYVGIITISDNNAVNSPKRVYIYLSVKSNTEGPFGHFTTPANGSTVRSSVPVTGWALDDIEVESVKIYRELDSNLVYIGDAVFVEGARPDVEAIYPTYPNSSRAGWGYMLLTYGLPNRGMSDTFSIHAIAIDKEGNEIDLGTKVIHCDNQNAVKPFGALDQPKQGGEANGSTFMNWGWALTPQPNMISIDGSTISVVVDGVVIGNPVYNLYRADIASRYPGYLNTDGAVGYFYLDTTAYDNGVHTISWRVEDNNGNVDGIGSRFFSILNTTTSPGSLSGSKRFDMKRDNERNKLTWLQSCTEDTSTIRITKNCSFSPEYILLQYRSSQSGFEIDIEELELLSIVLSSDQEQPKYSGYLKVGEELRSLPIGSTLDSTKGVFYWDPGPGFSGEYHLVFFNENDRTYKNVKIKIVPKTFSRL